MLHTAKLPSAPSHCTSSLSFMLHISWSTVWLSCHVLLCWSGTEWLCFQPEGQLQKAGKKCIRNHPTSNKNPQTKTHFKTQHIHSKIQFRSEIQWSSYHIRHFQESPQEQSTTNRKRNQKNLLLLSAYERILPQAGALLSPLWGAGDIQRVLPGTPLVRELHRTSVS